MEPAYLGVEPPLVEVSSGEADALDLALRTARAAGSDWAAVVSRATGAGLSRRRAGTSSLSLPDSDPEELLWRLGRVGLWLGLVAVPEVDVTTPAAVEESWRRLRTHAALCLRLGVGLLVHGSGSGLPPSPTAERAALIERLAHLAERLTGEYGLRLAASLGGDGCLATVDDARYYLAVAREPMVGVMPCTGRLAAVGQAGWELLREHHPRVPVILWQDYFRGARAGELGQGDTPLESWLPVLGRLPHKPLCWIDYGPARQTDSGPIHRSLEYFRLILGRAGLITDRGRWRRFRG